MNVGVTYILGFYQANNLRWLDKAYLLYFCAINFYSLSRGKIMKTILLILIGKRKDAAVKVQQILTAWGCNIKTRLGIHDGVLENCSDTGLLILELVGKPEDNKEIARKVALIPGVSSQLVELDAPNE
jgi:hypothetical protein